MRDGCFRLIRIVVAAASLFCVPSFAQRGAVSPPDPFTLNEAAGFQGYNNPNGLARRTQAFNSSQKNLALIVAGQSQCTSINPTLFVPSSSSAIDNFNIEDGGSYEINGPLLGAQNAGVVAGVGGPGNVSARLAQLFITNAIFDRVVVVPTCIGTTTAIDWATGAQAVRLPVTMARLASRGITPTTTGWSFAIVWWEGETAGITGVTSPQYVSAMNTVLANAQTAGFSCANCRFFINTETWVAGSVSATIQGAQASVISGNPTKFFAGGNVDSLNATNRQTDNTHLNDTGAPAAALLVYNAMHATGAPF